VKRLCTFLSASFFLSLGLVFAHAFVETSTPEDGAVLSEAPTEIVLNFKENIEAEFSLFKVYPLPAELIADAAIASESTHSDETAHNEVALSEGGETSSETTMDEHASESEHSSEAGHSETEAHSEGGTSSERKVKVKRIARAVGTTS
jgi:methionine-rich copper-binding protein CopC